MDDTQRETFRTLGEEVDGLFDEVEAAQEEHATFAQGLSTRVKVEEAVKRYREMKSSLSEMDRMQVDRTVGRKIIDLQKAAAPLPSPPAGSFVEKRGKEEFFEARPISASSSRQPKAMGVEAARPRGITVGGEVEAWCNRCDGVHTHTILAVNGKVPLQVTCHACKGTHKYREEAPAPRKTASAPTTTYKKQTGVDRETQQRMNEKNALVEALRNATNVRPYDSKERYKVGEIIEHATFGRGKIENTLPRSMLVRFTVGLKTLKLG
jgi:hypothetical protein